MQSVYWQTHKDRRDAVYSLFHCNYLYTGAFSHTLTLCPSMQQCVGVSWPISVVDSPVSGLMLTFSPDPYKKVI